MRLRSSKHLEVEWVLELSHLIFKWVLTLVSGLLCSSLLGEHCPSEAQGQVQTLTRGPCFQPHVLEDLALASSSHTPLLGKSDQQDQGGVSIQSSHCTPSNHTLVPRTLEFPVRRILVHF